MLNKEKTYHYISILARPLRDNWLLFIMMYALGCAVAWLTLPDTKYAKLYENLYPELFFDIYAVCIILSLIPEKVRVWVRGVLYVILYAMALVDVYCFMAYKTTMSPTVMMLIGETDSREAGEFLSTVFSPDIILGKTGVILLLVIINIMLAAGASYLRKKKGWSPDRVKNIRMIESVAGILLLGEFIYTGMLSAHNKEKVWELMTADNIGEVEHALTEQDHGVMYMPIYRFAFSMYANSLTAQQITKLEKAANDVKVDSCSFTSPNIVLIIGESYSRHHSQQYGYWQPTTPRQSELEKTGRLVRYSDVVAPWNLTSFVFKLLFSTYTVGDKGEWCDYPLFPELFKASGYHVTFLTNQFLPQAREAVYDFSGGFFLNNPVLSKAQFDTRNTKLYRFDKYLIDDYDRLKDEAKGKPSLTIFHLIGQHVVYNQRYPSNRKKFREGDYKEAKPNLNLKERMTLADYDNAILYNDSIVTEIVKRFENQDAIVIYVPDHGEECYEGNMHFICRMHSAEITARLAHAEFDIPFWIYCSHEYAVKHPEIYKQVVMAKDRRYMTDALPHLLMYLAGIHSKDYHEEYNLLSPNYNEKRKRILKNTTDYDSLK